MPRVKSLPDQDVFDVVVSLLIAGGDKAVAFSSVARLSGLAAATLAQRFGTRDGMVRAAMLACWDRLDQTLAQLDADLPLLAKGAVQLLKPLDLAPQVLLISLRDPQIRARALAWRSNLEAALAKRVDGGAELFALWQGQVIWAEWGGKGFRLKDAAKRFI